MAGAGAYRGGYSPGRVMGSQDARGDPTADQKSPLSRRCLVSCGSPAVSVGLRFRVGLRTARDPFAMDILLGDRVALAVRLLVDRGFTVITVRARCYGRG